MMIWRSWFVICIYCFATLRSVPRITLTARAARTALVQKIGGRGGRSGRATAICDHRAHQSNRDSPMIEENAPKQMLTEGTKPKVEVAFGKDQLNRPYVLVTVGDQKALLSPSDLMLPPQKLAQVLAQRGVLVFNKAMAADIVAAAEATAKATGGKPTFEVALVPGWHYRDVSKTADLYQAKTANLYLHGATLIGNASGVFVDPSLLILGDRPRKFASRGDRRAWRKLVKRFAVGQ